ncbi:hypothetical protein B0H11DRAFT_2420116 [Mycena galericulata]|nr:hypothetical protein B0H11DRAFT_2420116 [Mycena galericulata]
MQTWYPEGAPLYPKYYFPPGPPAFSTATCNPNPPPWTHRPQNASSTGSHGGSQASRGKEMYTRGGVPSGPPGPFFGDNNPTPPYDRTGDFPGGGSRSHSSKGHGPGVSVRNMNAAHTHPDLVDGLDYFRIGDNVRIRRWDASKGGFSTWSVGQVARPRLVENDDGTHRRSYLVAYQHYDGIKEREFSPHFQEIASLKKDPNPATPNIRLGENSRVVFVPVQFDDQARQKRVIYTPVQVLTSPNERGRAHLRILAGPRVNFELIDFTMKHAVPHNTQSAQKLREQGFAVEGDGTLSTGRLEKNRTSTYATPPM